MARWTDQQVAQLAPDPASVTAARKLARPGPWFDTGSTDALVWGKCQGSGSTPYQVSVDLTGPAFTCSCPSRKFPCKHGLALLFLWVGGDGSVADAEAPADFADDWARGRQGRAQPRGGAAAEPSRPVDPAARAARLEERKATMRAGMADFALWLGDLVRNGIAGARREPYRFWDDAAARLVDAQLPALAERVRSMASTVAADPEWADLLLAEIGRWWMTTAAWMRLDELGPEDIGNLRAYVGWPYSTEEIRAGDAVTDRWQVLGVHRTEEGRLQVQRTWLRGEGSGEVVVVLDFANVGGALGVAKVVGTVVEATIARYPGTWPRRALFVGEPAPASQATALPDAVPIEQHLVRFAEALGAGPWVDRIPVTIAGATVGIEPGDGRADRLWVVDRDGAVLPLVGDTPVWELLARTGNHPVDLFGELERGTVRPLTVAVAGTVVPL
jgi:hypothetical protein